MAINVTVRWAGPSDAGAASTYKVERSLNWSSWTELAAAQASTSPYVSVNSTLNGAHAYGVATVTLVNAASFSAAGYAWIEDALIQWTGKSTNDLTGVTWHSGYGTYATATAVYEAHENYTDAGITPSLYAVVYRITHTNPSSLVSAPRYIWYYYPPAPSSADHCVVVVSINGDLGMEPQSGVLLSVYLATDTQFGDYAGQHLDADTATASPATTDALGMACLQCWKNSARAALGGSSDAAYTFLLNTVSGQLSITATTIPDRDWVLLRDIGTLV